MSASVELMSESDVQRIWLDVIDQAGRQTVAMKEGMARAFHSYSEGEEQQQVRHEVGTNFARFVEKARERATDPSSGVSYTVDEKGNEEISVNLLNEMLWIRKKTVPQTGTTTYGVFAVSAREKKRLFRAPRIRTSAHINDTIALQRAQEFFDVTPVTPQALHQLPNPTPHSKAK